MQSFNAVAALQDNATKCTLHNYLKNHNKIQCEQKCQKISTNTPNVIRSHRESKTHVQESVSSCVCRVTSCRLFVLLSQNQRLITGVNTQQVITHTCANIQATQIRPVLFCHGYSLQVVTRVGPPLTPTNALQSRIITHTYQEAVSSVSEY